MRDTYYISVPAGPDQEAQIEGALRAIYELGLERFDVVRSKPAAGVSARENKINIYKASGRIYFYGTPAHKIKLEGAGFHVCDPDVSYPDLACDR